MVKITIDVRRTAFIRGRVGLNHQLTTCSTKVNDFIKQFEVDRLNEQQGVEIELCVNQNEDMLLEYEEIQIQIE